MPYLFYGEDTFSMRQKIKLFEGKLKARPGGEFGLERLDGALLTRDQFINGVLSASLFSLKKLIEIKNLLLLNPDNDLKRYIAKNLDKIPDSSIVLFIEEGLPKSGTVLFKALNLPRQAQNFAKISRAALDLWIKERVKNLGGEISQRAGERLASFVGADLWRLDNEVNKLVLFRQRFESTIIEEEDIEEMVPAPNNQNIFALTDALSQRNLKSALISLQNLIARGENSQFILSMIVYHYRSLLIVNDFLSQNLSSNQISRRAGLHPFVVKKNLATLKQYRSSELRTIYVKLEECDFQIKSGELEAETALFVLVANLCKK